MNYRRIGIGKRIEDLVDHVLHSAFGCINGEPCTGVILTSFFPQLGDVLFKRPAAASQHRARLCAGADSSRNHVRACIEADNDAAIAKRRVILRVNDCAAAGGNDRGLPIATVRATPGVRCDFRNHTPFNRAEMRLTMIAEDLMNRLTGSRADLSITVDQAPSQPLGQEPGDRAFASPHKAGQDQLRRHFFSPTRQAPRAPLSRSVSYTRTTI